MSEETLTVHFRGICTHFRGVVAGIPHRVVLPDASPARSGRVKIGDRVERYDVESHLPMIVARRDHIRVDGFIEDRKIINGVRLEITNAIGPLEYAPKYDAIYRLTQFVPEYTPSDEVIYAGRARCYFDFFNGSITADQRGEALNGRITIRTEGLPCLQVTPLAKEPPAPRSDVWRFQLQSKDLVVGNWSTACVKLGTFDFLLHYLTAEGGIPLAVSADFPIERRDRAIDRDMWIEPSVEDLTRCIDQEGDLAMCSDSRYP